MGYPKDFLSTRAIIKHGNYALIPPEGLVNNVIPGFEDVSITILASPKLGASFVDYIATFHKNGRNEDGFAGQEDVESFVYILEGKMEAKADDESFILEQGGFLFCPPGVTMYLKNLQDEDSKIFLYKQKHIPLEGKTPWVHSGNSNDIKEEIYDDMENVHLQDLLPTDLAFDMNFHILSFDPAASHPFVETHYQQHGAYLLSGEGMYNLDNTWVPVKKGDYIFMGPYNIQAAYGIGRERLTYLYSKDCNRDVPL